MPVYKSKLVNLIFGDFFMKKLILWLTMLGLLTSSAYAKKVEQTICFSQKDSGEIIGGNPYYLASLGDKVSLNGGKCQGKTLLQMNKKGWKVIQVVTGLNQSFGMILEK